MKKFIAFAFVFSACLSAQVQLGKGVQLGANSPSGLTSLNGLTGPELTLESTDSSVTITTPDSTHINLKAATSSGSVQYNPTTTNYYIWADSRGVVSSSCYLSQAPGPDVTISAGTVSSGVLTATTSTNYYVLPTTVTLSGFTGSYTALNGQIVTLTSVPSSTQIVGPVTGVSNGSTGAGAAGCSYNPSGQLRTEPYISGHGTVINGSVSNLTTAQAIAQYTANVHPYSPAVTGYPGFLIMQLGLGDWYSSPGTWNLAITEANLQTLWATARADGWTVVETTVIPHTGSIYTSSATDISTLNIWIRAQGPTNANSTSGKYWNRLEDAALMIPDPTDANYIMQSGGEVGHLTDMGAKRWMDDVNATFADQASSPQSVPFCGVLTGIACYGGIVAQVNSGLGLSYPNFSNTGSGPDSGYQNVSWNYNYNTQAVTAEVPLATSSLFGLVKPDGTSCTVTSGVLSCSGSSSGLSGMTAGQVPIAATASTITSSKALAGSGAAIVTGPASSTANDLVSYADTSGTQQDSGIAGTNVVNAVSPSSPITASISGHTLNVACPTCGTGSGGTSVSQNSGSAETNLAITGHMPQVCSDTSGSGAAQSCSVANTFTPQAGNCLVYKTTTANSGTGLTVNINSLGAKSVAVASSSGWTTTLVASSSIPANKPMNLCYDGTNWDASGTGYVPTSGSSTPAWVVDEMLETSNGIGTGVGIGPFGWNFGSSVSGVGQATNCSAAICGGHQGVWTTNNMTGSGNWVELENISGSGNSLIPSSSSGYLKVAAELYGVLGTGTTLDFGFGDTVAPNPTHEISFRCDPNGESGSTNWYIYNSNGPVETTTGVACTAWHQLEIVVNNLSATWYIDNVSVGTGTVVGANYGIMLGGWNHNGNGTPQLYIDWVAMPSSALTSTFQ